MVADVIDALGVPGRRRSRHTSISAIATDTGGFRYGPISARTFEICRRIAATGVEPAALSRADLRQLPRRPRQADRRAAQRDGAAPRQPARGARRSTTRCSQRCGATVDDTEGLVNLPLGAREVVAVALFKRQADNVFRVSLRSKGAVDVRAVAALWGGGGHRNAAGCTITGRRMRRSEIARRRSALGRRRIAPMAASMDGVLLIDKPAGPDLARRRGRIRRVERRAQHRAHRHARSAGDRAAAARARPGDAAGLAAHRRRQDLRGDDPPRLRDRHRRRGGHADRRAARPAAGRRRDRRGARARFAGTFEQVPPQHSAKKIGGDKAYELARRSQPVALKPVTVTVRGLERLGRDGDRSSRLRVTAARASTSARWRATSARALGCGAHLAALRRTASGPFRGRATRCRWTTAERSAATSATRLISPADALPHLPAVRSTDAGPATGAARQPVRPGTP